jgi:ribosomal protein L16/L10AE
MIYAIIIIKYKNNIQFNKSNSLGKNILRILNRYPVIIDIIGQAYKILTIKPILSRMGKGKGKIIGEYIPYRESNTLLQVYVSLDKMVYFINRIKKEGLFNSCALSVTIYYL